MKVVAIVYVLVMHTHGNIVFEPGKTYQTEAGCRQQEIYLNKLFEAEAAFSCQKSDVLGEGDK